MKLHLPEATPTLSKAWGYSLFNIKFREGFLTTYQDRISPHFQNLHNGGIYNYGNNIVGLFDALPK